MSEEENFKLTGRKCFICKEEEIARYIFNFEKTHKVWFGGFYDCDICENYCCSKCIVKGYTNEGDFVLCWCTKCRDN